MDKMKILVDTMEIYFLKSSDFGRFYQDHNMKAIDFGDFKQYIVIGNFADSEYKFFPIKFKDQLSKGMITSSSEYFNWINSENTYEVLQEKDKIYVAEV